MVTNIGYVTSLQPLTVEDAAAISEALGLAARVTVVLGSATSSRSSHLNPFSLAERHEMLDAAYRDHIANGRLEVVDLPDRLYQDDAWLRDLTNVVETRKLDGFVVVDDEKGRRRRYIERAGPVVGTVPFDWRHKRQLLIAYMMGNSKPLLEASPLEVHGFFDRFANTEPYLWLREEMAFLVGYWESWERAPYPPKFITADALIECRGRILMIKRGQFPGKGQWALPGGFLEEDETIDEAALRELREETGLDVTPSQESDWRIGERVFDLPHRDGRGRLVTHAYHYRVPGEVFPDVEARDDAVDVRWTLPGDIVPEETMADHYAIIRKLLSRADAS